MKKILITGAGSYIGTSLERYLSAWPDRYRVDTVDMIDGSWRETSFSGYDCVYHVAGIAHADTGAVSEERKALYYRVNTDLAVETARKAKADGVRQFIFMSSASVYGSTTPIGKANVVERDTPFQPSNVYGDSKVKAEQGILPLSDERFKVAILRPPMIYGPGSKGNYPTLSKLAKKLPFFPVVENRRSMLFIDNLTEFVRLIVDHEDEGIFWPQNAEYSNTTKIVRQIAEIHGRRILFVRGVTWALKLLSLFTKLPNKAFGNMTYAQELSAYREPYQKYSLEESIRITEQT
ncbi:MAG: NAD-dependent epimerase/dehydratase family protein [Oscillospiraceae bacterium]|nr:NAD-dependent epimerase/dehydratase family protein [Oscillospiraceae bacterium]